MNENCDTVIYNQSPSVIKVENLNVEYQSEDGRIKALRNVNFRVAKGEIVGVAGESGSGKSTLAYAILQYLGENGRITDGEILFENENLCELNEKPLRKLRGNKISHVPQDPNKSLNPSIKIGEQIREVVLTHKDVTKSEADRHVDEILREVQIPDPEYNKQRYPHELSGGMQQRVLIAMALVCSPKLLILDEPTTGLDVTTQAKILNLIDNLIQHHNTSAILVTHDLRVIAQSVEKIIILYAGEILEIGPVEDVFKSPANPYPSGLLKSIPQFDDEKILREIPGIVPDLQDIPDGCIFADRCSYKQKQCQEKKLELSSVSNNHLVRCIRSDEIRGDLGIFDDNRSSEDNE